MNESNSKNTNSANTPTSSAFDKIQAKVIERSTLEMQYIDDGKPKFAEIRARYNDELMRAIQTRQAERDEAMREKFGSDEEWAREISILETETLLHCYMCGVPMQ